MLKIGRVESLCRVLETTPKRLDAVLGDIDKFCVEFELIDPAKPSKRRRVLDVRGPLRTFQQRLFRKALAPRLQPSPYSYGAVKGRNIKGNAEPHRKSRFFLKADIADFYPSIKNDRVHRLFLDRLGCSPAVARLCTRLCTYNYHLALGLVTSPILADQVLHPVDRRIAAVSAKAGLVYTRYVDDITVSGSFDFTSSGLPATIAAILADYGFKAHPDKWEPATASEGVTVTGVRIRRGRIGLPAAYVESVEDQIHAMRRLAAGKPVSSTFATRSQLMGRIGFAKWIDPRRAASLRAQADSINWERATAQAERLGLVEARKRLVPICRHPSPGLESISLC